MPIAPFSAAKSGPSARTPIQGQPEACSAHLCCLGALEKPRQPTASPFELVDPDLRRSLSLLPQEAAKQGETATARVIGGIGQTSLTMRSVRVQRTVWAAKQRDLDDVADQDVHQRTRTSMVMPEGQAPRVKP